MVPANKILTVTYGTFSCTLEGFEDPFTAMTEIAEYFRDLASKDRYFGAEPPTPDMEKLEQITAASMKGPVSADDSSGRLVLRPGEVEPDLLAAVEDKISDDEISDGHAVDGSDDGDVQANDLTGIDLPAEDDQSQQDATPSEDEAPAQAAADDLSTQDGTDELPGQTAANETESAMAKLARLRGVAAADTSEPAAFDAEDDDFEAVQRPTDDHAAMSVGMAEGSADLPAKDDTPGGADGPTAATERVTASRDDDISTGDRTAMPGTVETVSDAVPVEAPLPEAAMLKLDLEKAELTEADASAEEADASAESVTEDLTETVVVRTEDVECTEETVIEATEDLVDNFDAPAGRVEALEKDATEAEDDVAASMAGALSATPAQAEIETEIEAQTTELEIGPEPVAAQDGTAPEAEADPEAASEAEDSLAADLAAMFSPRPEEEPEPAAEQPTARVTVRKVRKRLRREDTTHRSAPAATSEEDWDEDADLMAELSAIEAELARDATGATVADATEDDDADDAEQAVVPEDTVPMDADFEMPGDAGPDDDDDDLLSELAAIEAETASVTLDKSSEDAKEIEEAETTEAEPNDLERLFAATDSRLSGEDASRRHANISHLKAAVAARRADDTIETEKADVSGAYRKDLANTVRPRRKSTGPDEISAEARPERGAPLVLISEQRVEATPDPEEATPAARQPEVDIAEGLSKGLRAPDTGDDFEQFASDVGAVDLPDVLEAAAVYSATVMGQDSFSRPRLLHLAAEAVDDLSREDGLRGFGQLLRDGTIRKVGRGTFTLGTESRFQTKAARRAG